MSAQLRPEADRFAPMTAGDLDDVVEVERHIYPFPWTHGNFADSLRSGYSCWVLRDPDQCLQAYAVVMLALDEAHLLNLSVARERSVWGWDGARSDGWRRWRAGGARTLLPVRPSNPAAMRLSPRYGFERIGLRRGYYPAREGREDAIVMRISL
jgi:ribosomal-protein-alanine N-acetyltransferase